LDGRKIQVFDSNGEFRKSILLEVSIQNFSVTSEGHILARINPSMERKKAIVRMDKEGKILSYVAEFSDVKPAIRTGGTKGSHILFTTFHDYSPRPCFSSVNGQSFSYGFPLKYELLIVDNMGNLMLKIQKEEKPQSISQREKRKIIDELIESISNRGRMWPEGVLEEACQFPSYRPFFDRILNDDKGRIYVRKVTSVLNRTGKIEFDIFNKSGYYLYKTTMPFSPEIIKNGYLYDQHTSEETGEVRIRRYKVKNWNQLKERI